MPEVKLSEWRPKECSTRLGDIVMKGTKKFLKIKCRRCTKTKQSDVFHLVELASNG